MRTALIVTVAPGPFLSLVDAKAHLRVETSDDDALITGMIAAVCGTLDGPDGSLKRAIGLQTLKLVLPGFLPEARRWRNYAASSIYLPLPPAVEVSAIEYLDTAGAVQTLDPAQYRVLDCGFAPLAVIPVWGASWPSTACQPDAVTVTYTAGFVDDEDAAWLPDPIAAAARLMLGDLYANRQATTYTTAQAVANPAVAALLAPWRLINF